MQKISLKYLAITSVVTVFFTLVIISIFHFIPINIFSKNQDIDNEFVSVDEAINNYFENNSIYNSKGGKVFESHLTLGKEKSNEEISVYLWMYFKEYLFKGKLEEGSTGIFPLVVKLKKKSEQGYVVTQYLLTEEGENYNKSVKKLFPSNIQDMFLMKPDHSFLETEVLEKAKAYYNVK